MHEDGRRAGLVVDRRPPAPGLPATITKGGITDGVPGLVISAMNAYYVFLKFETWELCTVEALHRDGAKNIK